MSSERQVAHIWTCDACGHAETVDDSGSGRPTSDKGWRQIVFGALHDKLGNLPSHDLCGNCAHTFALLMQNTLGDCGDLRIAWDEGVVTALDFATRNEDGVTLSLDLDAHPNPYATPPATNTPARRGSEGES